MQSSLGIDETCKSISYFIEIDVDNERFVLEGSQFRCMLNNDIRFSESTVDFLSEQRWAIISRFKGHKARSKARYAKAVEFIKEKIVQEEAEKANPQTLAALTNKYAGTKYSEYFLMCCKNNY